MAQVNFSKASVIDRLDTLETDVGTLDDVGAGTRLDDLEEALVYASLSAAAEAANERVVTVQVKNFLDTNVAFAVKLRCELLTSAMLPAAAVDFTMAETGGGSEVTDTAKPQLIIETSAAGAASLTVTDVIGATNTTIYLVVTPLEKFGRPQYVALAFDGV